MAAYGRKQAQIPREIESNRPSAFGGTCDTRGGSCGEALLVI